MINTKEILTISKEYKVITFDVFDTLIIRDVEKPADVFRHSYGFWGKYFRILAEQSARKRRKNSEITLSEIGSYFHRKCNSEIEYEKRICRANPKVFELYKELKHMGKKIYAISDMYLDANTVSEILISSGYELDGVFVSSEYACTKETGKLFSVFLETNNYNPEEILHIGDNNKSDYEGACNAGIKAVLIPKHVDCLKYRRYSFKTDELDSFINHGLNEIDNPIERIGYEIVGPMVLCFCQWLHRQCKNNGFDRLYFLARDMHFTFDIYNRLYNDDTHYLCVSRKSLRNARNNPNDFIQYLNSEGCYGNIAVIDTGWVGTAQVEIEKYSKQIDPSTDLGGLYLGTNVAYRIRKRSKRSFACVYSKFVEQLKCELASAFLEVLIGSQERQVVSYENGVPIFTDDSTDDSNNSVKMGAGKFIEDWSTIKDNKKISPESIKKPFERLFKNPYPEDIDALGDMRCDDVEISRIISYGGKEKYKRHINLWFHDLSLSPWKGGYFKKSFRYYRPLLEIYILINTIRNALIDIKHIKRDRLE